MDTNLALVDWGVVATYMLFVGLVGYYAAGKQGSTRDYFLGGRSLPWWAASLSIIATETSAVTFIGIPAGAFGGNWTVLQLVLGFVLGRIFLALVFVRVFYRRDYLTVYGYLERRFGEKTRSTAALFFLFGRLIASGVRLFAGCLAVHIATNLPIEWIIIGLGAFGTIFTYIGGIRAVVWTDVILGLTLVAGALFAVFFLFDAIPGGSSAVWADPQFSLSEKLKFLNFDFRLNENNTLWAGLLGGFVLTLATHGTDQDIAQRMLTCRDSRSGSFSVLGSAVLILPLFVLFLFVGTLLFFYHKLGNPPYDMPASPDHIFPLFIVHDLPKGVAGLVMAGLLAAALSSFTSALNALASTSIGDFYKPLKSRKSTVDESHFLTASKTATAFWGIALILAAWGFVDSRENVFVLAIKVFSYFYGALLGSFLLGILTRRGSDGSALVGMLCSLPVVFVLQLREFVGTPERAPGLVREWIAAIPAEAQEQILRVPDIASHYWIIITTAVCLVVGLLRSQVIVQR